MEVLANYAYYEQLNELINLDILGFFYTKSIKFSTILWFNIFFTISPWICRNHNLFRFSWLYGPISCYKKLRVLTPQGRYFDIMFTEKP